LVNTFDSEPLWCDVFVWFHASIACLVLAPSRTKTCPLPFG
jgi:hypothetical protein